MPLIAPIQLKMTAAGFAPAGIFGAGALYVLVTRKEALIFEQNGR